jgi:hypothetical protein
MSSTHRHLLLDFFWQVISGPPCMYVFFYIKKYSKSNTYFNFNVDIFDFGFQFLSTDNRKLKIDTIYLHFTL